MQWFNGEYKIIIFPLHGTGKRPIYPHFCSDSERICLIVRFQHTIGYELLPIVLLLLIFGALQMRCILLRGTSFNYSRD